MEIIDQLKIHIPDDLESILFEEEEHTDNTLLALEIFREDYPCTYHYKELNPTKTYPQTHIHILPTKKDEPIPTVAFLI